MSSNARSSSSSSPTASAAQRYDVSAELDHRIGVSLAAGRLSEPAPYERACRKHAVLQPMGSLEALAAGA